MKRTLSFQKPTEAELEILQILWAGGAATVRTVNDLLTAQTGREIGYTTTLKIMQIMSEKGLLSRIEDGRMHIYAATVEESDLKGKLFQQFADTVFRGSAMQIALHALGNHEATAEELDEIKKLISELEKNQQ